MDLLAAYGDDSDDEQQQQNPASAAAAAASSSSAAAAAAPAAAQAKAASSAAAAASASAAAAAAPASASSAVDVDLAPDVPLDSLTQSYYVNPQHNTLYFNPKVDELYTPLAGPFRPGQTARQHQQSQALLAAGATAQGLGQNHQRGFVEKMHMSNFVFEDNYHSFTSKGVAVNPTAPAADSGTLVSQNLVFNSNRMTEAVPGFNARVLTGQEKSQVRAKRKAAQQDPSDVESWRGPWASRETDADERLSVVGSVPLTDEQKAEAERVRNLKRHKKAAAAAAAAGGPPGEESEEAKAELDAAAAALESTVFHGEQERDYQGRTYITPPSTLQIPNELACYLPKRLVHTFSGHSKGVNAIRYFPTTGHVLLSASNDKTVKVWNVVSSAQGGYKCLRTINAHAEAVRGIDFNYDGTRFVSCSYDKYVKLWDTETGKCISRHSSGKIPFVAKIHPEAASSHEILVGQQNKLVTQWDVRANEIVQTYNEHLGPVNTITFIDENRRFVSSSDDKKIFVW
jgi:pre-mRNA-processing factor 17